MLTDALMALILLFLGCLLIVRDSKGKASSFFDLQNSNCLRGFWCLVIVLVHIPQEYQNFLQDAVGSFAYIGVSFFFMTSGYGLVLSVKRDPNSIKKAFWRRRLVRLLVPLLLVNMVTFVIRAAAAGELDLLQLVAVTAFVRQILLFYALFWLVFRCLPEKVAHRTKILLLSLAVVVFSLAIYFARENLLFGWPVESMGFLYGILLAECKAWFESRACRKTFVKIAAAAILSAVFGILYLKYKHIFFAGEYLVKLALGVAILLLMLLLNTKFSVGNPVSRFLGSISYEVYLSHNAVFILLAALPVKLASGVFVTLSLVFTVAVSYVVKLCGSSIIKLFDKVLFIGCSKNV